MEIPGGYLFNCYYPCQINFSSYSPRQFILHLRTYHIMERFQFTCNIDNCLDIFHSVNNFRKHVVYAHGARWNENPGVVPSGSGNVFNETENCVVTIPPTSSENSNVVTGVGDRYSSLISSVSRQYSCLQLKLRYLYSLPEWKVGSVTSSVSDLVINFKSLYDDILSSQLQNISIPEDTQFMLGDSISLENAFRVTKSDETKLLADMGYVPPVEVVFSNEGEHKECGHYVPVKQTLQNYVIRPDVLGSIKRENVKSGLLDKMIAGDIMNVHPVLSLHKSALRLIAYTDEFQLGNAIGPHTKTLSIVGVYFSVSNIESSHSSKLLHIHLAMLVKECYVKKYSGEVVYKRLIDDLKELESIGLNVTVEGVDYHFMVAVSNFVGDNKSLHYLGGFSVVFSSGKACRFCLVDFKNLGAIHYESECPLLRTREVHDYHVDSVGRDSQLSSVYGVTGPSPFSKLMSFHPTMSLPSDIMHDLYEGVMPMNLTAVIRGLIKDKVLIMADMRQLFATFNYGVSDMSVNDTVCFSVNFPGKNTSISGTAKEKMNLFYLFSLVVGPSVPIENKYWQLHLKCVAVCDILLAPKLKPDWIAELSHLIAEYLSLWSQLPQEVVGNVKPKMHYLVHTPQLLCTYGPLRLLSCMKYEHFHQYYKNDIRFSKNFINPTLTLATNFQKRRCLEYDSSDIFLSADIGSAQKTVESKTLNSMEKAVVSAYFQMQECSLVSVTKVKIHGLSLRAGEYVIIDVTHDDVPIFLKIINIYSNGDQWGLYGRLTFPAKWSVHLHAYEVGDEGESDDYVCVSSRVVAPLQCLSLYCIRGRSYLKVRHSPVSEH